MSGYSAEPTDSVAALVERLVRAEERIAELERPAGTQVAGTVAELTKRTAYSATNIAFSHLWMASTGWIDLGVPIDFTLTESRRVLIRAGLSALIYNYVAASTNASVALTVEGIPPEVLSGGTLLNTFVLVNNGAAMIGVRSPLIAEETVVLPAGSYSLSAWGSGSRSGATVAINSLFDSPSLYVQVMEKV